MGYTSRITLAFVVGMLPMGLIHAQSGQGELRVASLQGAEQITQMAQTAQEGTRDRAAPAANPASVKLSDDNYKWLIKASAEGYKWAIPAGNNSIATDKPGGTPEAKPEEGKKSTSYYRPANSYATNPDSDPPRYVRRLSQTGIGKRSSGKDGERADQYESRQHRKFGHG